MRGVVVVVACRPAELRVFPPSLIDLLEFLARGCRVPSAHYCGIFPVFVFWVLRAVVA